MKYKLKLVLISPKTVEFSFYGDYRIFEKAYVLFESNSKQKIFDNIIQFIPDIKIKSYDGYLPFLFQNKISILEKYVKNAPLQEITQFDTGSFRSGVVKLIELPHKHYDLSITIH